MVKNTTFLDYYLMSGFIGSILMLKMNDAHNAQ